MFECTLEFGDLFRKIVASIQDLVTDGNFVCDEHHISFQGMDSSHVSLVALSLRKEGFEIYRCDREVTLGINFTSLSKVLKCMSNNDKLSIRASDGDNNGDNEASNSSDSAFFIFEDPNQERISNFELKLMDIDTDQLGIPETDYKCNIQMPSSEFQRIMRDLSQIGDTVTISATKEGIKFSVNGDIGSGDMVLKQTSSENADVKIKNETKGGGNSNNDKKDSEEDEDDCDRVIIDLEEPIQQTFALRYLCSFTKATSLSKRVVLSMGAEVPLVTEYIMDNLGSIRYYLAPKIDDDNE